MSTEHGRQLVEISGYPVRLDLAYFREADLWVEVVAGGRARVGLDPLGAETSGTLAQLALVAAGTAVTRGQPLGSLEAEKFVGPLVAPLTGSVVATNEAVVARPSLVEEDPYGAWLVEIELAHTEELGELVSGERVAGYFADRVERYRKEGVLAE
ncbi:MAG TPA: glycine cleavage system protein H [Acidimicrobiales bacterium]|nr:glycine cleavage system protein H [Acidimicrobiales bacterium]